MYKTHWPCIHLNDKHVFTCIYIYIMNKISSKNTKKIAAKPNKMLKSCFHTYKTQIIVFLHIYKISSAFNIITIVSFDNKNCY